MPNQELVIENINDLESSLDLIIENLNDAIAHGVVLGDFEIPTVEIKISDGNPEHNSTLTTTMMKSFVGFQNRVYDILEIANERELTEAERKAAEVRIKVEEGSTNILVPLYQLVAAGVPNMTLEHAELAVNTVLKAVAIICVLGMMKEGFKVFSRERIEKIRARSKEKEVDADREIAQLQIAQREVELQLRSEQDERVHQERIAQIEKEKTAILADKEKTIAQYASVENLIMHTSSAEKYIYRGLAEESQRADVAIDGETYQQEVLENLGRVERRPRVEQPERVVNVRGNFKTEVISYEDIDVRKINISGLGDDGEEYSFDGLPVSKDALTPELYELINEGSPLYWNLSVTMKGDKWESILLVDLKRPNQDSV